MIANIDPRQTVYVARQPILDRHRRVHGYELLYRGDPFETSCTSPGDLASARTLTDALLTLGLGTITEGRPAFFNLTHALLLSDIASVVPTASSVLELREDIPVDQHTIEACRRLHAAGHTLALDDFVPGSDAEALLPYVKFVKIDVLSTSAAERASVARWLAPRVRLIAEKVETAEMFEATRDEGYGLFQGFFFCRPTTLQAGTLPSRRLAYLHLLAAVNRPNLTLFEVEDLVKHDVSLTYRVLRCVNSAACGLHKEVDSIRQALVLLGISQVRKWASVWSIAGLSSNAASEVTTIALIRARCCELLGEQILGDDHDSGLFLLGLCSLLDVMLETPMENAIAQLPLSAEIRGALLGQANRARTILDMVVAYERADWSEAVEAATSAGLPPEALPTAYATALRWARELSRELIAA